MEGRSMVARRTELELEVHERIRRDSHEGGPSRRAFLRGAAVAAAGAALLRSGSAEARTAPELAARLPDGFTPFSAPGRVVRVQKAGCLEANGICPKPDDAQEMLRRALEELTGKADMAGAAKL